MDRGVDHCSFWHVIVVDVSGYGCSDVGLLDWHEWRSGLGARSWWGTRRGGAGRGKKIRDHPG